MSRRTAVSFWFANGRCCRMQSANISAELSVISAKGRNGTAELLKIIANEDNDCIPRRSAVQS